MKTYKLPNFDIELDDPAIEADPDSIHIKPTQGVIDVTVSFTTSDARVRKFREYNVPVENMSWESQENLMERVLPALEKYLV